MNLAFELKFTADLANLRQARKQCMALTASKAMMYKGQVNELVQA